jgi:hypothetical protein
LEVGLTIEGAISDEIGGAIGGWPWGDVCTADLTERVHITTRPTKRLHQDRHASLVLHAPLEHHGVEVGPMIPALPPRDVHDLCCRLLAAVIVAIDRDAGAIKMRQACGKP